MDQAIVDLYDEYAHRPLPRRRFLSRLARLAGSVAAARAALAMLEPASAAAAIVAEDDPRIEVGEFGMRGVELRGYAAFPRDDAAARARIVFVLHENRGLNAHIRDVARKFALEGFFAVAPDLLLPLGGTPDDSDAAREMIGRLKPLEAIGPIAGAIDGMKERNPRARAAAVGFCWGGGMVNRLATATPTLDAGVVYYGVAPPLGDVPKITASLMLHHAGVDERVNATLPAYEAALKAAGVDYRLFMYEGAQHAFNNDTSAARYDAAAAGLAFGRTIAFLKEKLSA